LRTGHCDDSSEIRCILEFEPTPGLLVDRSTVLVAWCHEGIRKARVVGEILIVDSSTDRTADIALARGCDAFLYIRGRYVVVGDADCTY